MKLKKARLKAKKSQEAVADHCKISRRHYQNIEYGDNPSVQIALRIAKFLDVSPFYIDEWYEKPPVSIEPNPNRKRSGPKIKPPTV